MRSSESIEHKKIKEIVCERLKEWTGATIQEYQSSGHALDVFAATPLGVTICVEIIWSGSRGNFFRDLSLIHNAERNVKAGIILAIGVLEGYRKSGVGTRLVLHGLEALRNEKMDKALLDVDDLNQTGAMRLYENVGFKVVEKYLTYEKPCS